MAKLKIYEYPHPILKKKAVQLEKEEFNAELKQLLEDMLAAPQVGISKRVVVIDVEQDEEGGKPGNPLYFVNPEIIWRSEEKVCGPEGCLSVPDQRAEVERFAAVKVRYFTPEGEEKELEAEGFLAVAVQHELDHLDGILYIDRISRLKRQMLVKKLQKAREKFV